MNSLRVYFDASVFGGCLEDRFERGSKALFEAVRGKRIVPLISDMLIAELARAPRRVQDVFSAVLRGGSFERLEAGDVTAALQEAYLYASVVTENYADDALHVAHPTLAKADVVVSWNFKHLVHPARVRAFNAVNTERGYGPVVIPTPDDVVGILEEESEREDET